MPGEAQSEVERLAQAISSLQAVVAQLAQVVYSLRGQTREQARRMTPTQPTGQRLGR